jgi:hypothetical protein
MSMNFRVLMFFPPPCASALFPDTPFRFHVGSIGVEDPPFRFHMGCVGVEAPCGGLAVVSPAPKKSDFGEDLYLTKIKNPRGSQIIT